MKEGRRLTCPPVLFLFSLRKFLQFILPFRGGNSGQTGLHLVVHQGFQAHLMGHVEAFLDEIDGKSRIFRDLFRHGQGLVHEPVVRNSLIHETDPFGLFPVNIITSEQEFFGFPRSNQVLEQA